MPDGALSASYGFSPCGIVGRFARSSMMARSSSLRPCTNNRRCISIRRAITPCSQCSSLSRLALRLGVTDLNWLARLLSFGMFALPTAIYHLALVRAREDAALLAAVIIAIAAIFMTTSFSIVGEYNTACALAVLAAVLLTSNVRPSVIDALLLVAVAAFALRVYETFVFLGPALAAMALWTVRRGHCPGDGFAVSGVLRAALLLGFMAVVCLVSLIGRYAVFLPLGLILFVAATWAVVRVSARPLVARRLVVLAAALFAASAAVAVQSLVFLSSRAGSNMRHCRPSASTFSSIWRWGQSLLSPSGRWRAPMILRRTNLIAGRVWDWSSSRSLR